MWIFNIYIFLQFYMLFYQNIDKFINKEHLRLYLNEYECLHAFVDKVKHLALLPAEDIIPIFYYLVDSLNKLEKLPLLDGSGETFRPMDPFIVYFERYWLRQVTPEQFSVFLESKRTNNDTERNNREWNAVMGTHPNIVSFLGTQFHSFNLYIFVIYIVMS